MAAASTETRTGRVMYWLVGLVLAFVFVVPLLFAVYRSLLSPDAITSPPTAASATALSFDNYRDLASVLRIGRYIGNSLLVALGAAVLCVVLATLAGFGLGRFRFPLRSWVFGLLVVAIMIPFQAMLTPVFLELNQLGLVNSRVGLMLFQATYTLPFGVFVMRGAFQAIPREIEESAAMDGDSPLATLWHVLYPFVLPGAATTLLYTFLTSWTDFLGAFTLITEDDRTTLPVALLNISSGTYGQVNYGYLLAGSVIAMLPCIVLFVTLQRFYVGGLLSGALRG